MIPLIVFIAVFYAVLSLELCIYVLYLLEKKSNKSLSERIEVPVCQSEIPIDNRYFDLLDKDDWDFDEY
jgi:flagellar basal body-associated protein FliL